MLDIRTVLALTIWYSLIIGIGIVIYGLKRKNAWGIPHIGTGVVIYGSGFLILSFRDYFSVFFTVIIANLLIILGLSFILIGLTKFRKLHFKWLIINSIFLVFVLISFAYFTYIKPSINIRIIITSTIQTIYYITFIFVLSYKQKAFIGKGILFISTFYLFAIMINISRIILTILEKPMISFMSAGFIHSLSVIIYQVMPFVLSLGTFWISNSLMETELKTQAMTDSLTSLYNRSAFMQLSKKEIYRSERHGFNVGIVMGDIDFFKKVNDRYGHVVGDAVLQSISNILQINVRVEDIVGRYGGEEFILMIPGVNESELKKIAETVRIKIAESSVISGSNSIKVTMSFGGCIIKNENNDIAKGILCADKALYEAKNSGRNKVIIK